MAVENERMQILKMIDDGTITPEQGLSLLDALGDDTTGPEALEADVLEAQVDSSPQPPDLLQEPQVFGVESGAALPYMQPGASDQPEPEPEPEPVAGEVMPDFPPPPDFGRWKRWWQIPLWIGVAITVVGGLLMLLAWQASGLGFWFACAWFPFLIGVAVVALAWASSSMRWLHVRVHQKPGERPQTIAISIPLPLRLGAWFMRTFGHRIPNIDGQGLDQMILALEGTSKEAPFYVNIDDEDGERVEVFIG